jgi:uncharacterized protein
MRIRISWDLGQVFARLDDDTPGSRVVLAALPIRATASTRGEEVYLSASLPLRKEGSFRQRVEPGMVCYWAGGASIVLPFGPTPISVGGESRLISPCNVLGRLEDDSRVLGRIRPGHLLTVARA